MVHNSYVPTLQTDPLPLHFNRDSFAAANDANLPFLNIDGEPDDDGGEICKQPSDGLGSPPASGLITIGVNDGRLRKSEIEALNTYLARHGGQYEGHQLFRISWAAEDNYGLLKAHESTCPKRDPGDFDCGCPISTDARIPICFHPIQGCYHLLSWQPPTGEEVIAAGILGPAHVEQAKQEAKEGSWSCVMHFCDPLPPNLPFNPTAAILETIVPIINEEAKRYKAALHGANAVLMRERAKRVEQIKRERARQETAYDQRADDILRDAEPAFGGVPFAGSGEKHMQESDKSAGDAIRDGAQNPAPELDGPVLTLGRIKRTK